MNETATFAAGRFWGVEAAFRRVPGVLDTEVGYTGGHKPRPTHEEVADGRTGHAEAVRVVFDPEQVSYEDLLGVFWRVHDPTLRDRQGPDAGHHCRSAIFYHTPPQEESAHRSLKMEAAYSIYGGRPIVTEIMPAGPWWPAEDAHQQYYERWR